MFTDQSLISCINRARDRVCVDTTCCRVTCPMTLNPGQETYTFTGDIFPNILTLPSPPAARAVGAVLNINYQWSSTYTPPIRAMAWSRFNDKYRSNLVIAPAEAWAMYGQNALMIQPTVPQTAIAFVDCVYLPTNLVDLTNAENSIPDPLTELVPLKAAYWATYYEQDKTRCAGYSADYDTEKDAMLAGLPPFRIT